MNRLKKIAKALAIAAVFSAVLFYGGIRLGHHVLFPMHSSNVATIESVENEHFILGPDAHPDKPMTVQAFIPVLAGHLAHYNEIAENLWPRTEFADQSIIVEDIRRNNFYYISPDGMVTEISRRKVMDMGVQRSAYVNGFSAFDGGLYLAVAEEDITNYLDWQHYLHFGMYDAFMFFTHEGFHMVEQPGWAVPEDISNRQRSEYFEETEARTLRYILQRQLLDAVAFPDEPALILDALATYALWKESFPEDFKNALYFDRIEGTATYFELLTGLYIGYPDRIRNEEDLQNALSLLATRHDIYIEHGVIGESYRVGSFAAILLDRLGADWKPELMATADATPISLLYKYFENEELPPPVSITQQDRDTVTAGINAADSLSNRGRPLMFRMLYDMFW